jgi:hypothetical protein
MKLNNRAKKRELLAKARDIGLSIRVALACKLGR